MDNINQLKDGTTVIDLHCRDQSWANYLRIHAGEQLHLYRHTAKSRKPKKQNRHRNQQHAKYKLTNGTSTADTRNKDTDKWRSADPPCPIKYRPSFLPISITIGFAPRRQRDDVCQVVAYVFYKTVKDK